MNFYETLLAKLRTAAGDSTVATVAGVSAADWTSSHVFTGGRGYVGPRNRGRVPYVNIWRTNSDYAFDAVEAEGQQAGLLTSSWAIEIIVRKVSGSNESLNEAQAYEIAQKIIKAARAEVNMSVGTQTIGEVVPHPFGLALTVNMTIENTHMDSNK